MFLPEPPVTEIGLPDQLPKPEHEDDEDSSPDTIVENTDDLEDIDEATNDAVTDET